MKNYNMRSYKFIEKWIFKKGKMDKWHALANLQNLWPINVEYA